MLHLRGRPIAPFITDLSVVVTAVLLALSLPTLAPWWIPFIGAIIAVVFAKHLYGGLGYNPFNPAMVAFAVLMVSFPKDMTVWALPSSLQTNELGLANALAVLIDQLPSQELIDGFTAATPLDHMKTRLGLNEVIGEIRTAPLFGSWVVAGWEWVAIAYLCGGVFLIYKKVISWQIPTGLLAGLFSISFLFYLLDPSTSPSPLFHLLGGGTILAAFFIATDPVTASTTNKGRIIYAALIGALIYVIRTWGGYPDGVAFAVILINMAVPLIDHYTQPRVYGHKK